MLTLPVKNDAAPPAQAAETPRQKRTREKNAISEALSELAGRVHALRPSQIVVDLQRLGGRPIDEAHVAYLVESIRARSGLDLPIKVHLKEHRRTYENSHALDLWEVVDGAHRLEAWKQVFGDAPIPCIEPYTCEYPDQLRQAHDDAVEDGREIGDVFGRHTAIINELSALQDNHCRLELDPLSRAKTTARIAVLMLELEKLVPPPPPPVAVEAVPETLLATVANKSPPPRGRPRKIDSARAVAKKMGKSERTVSRDLRRTKTLGKTLDKITSGSALAKPAEMDALAALPTEEREALVARAAAGERVTARAAKPVGSDALAAALASSQKRAAAVERAVVAGAQVLAGAAEHAPEPTDKDIMLAALEALSVKHRGLKCMSALYVHAGSIAHLVADELTARKIIQEPVVDEKPTPNSPADRQALHTFCQWREDHGRRPCLSNFQSSVDLIEYVLKRAVDEEAV